MGAFRYKTYWLFTLMSVFSSSFADPFWVTIEVSAVDWRDGCLTTAQCSQPRFKLLEDLIPINEHQSVSWPVSDRMIQDSVRPFVAFWPSGRLDDLSLAAQVVGTDPAYGFPRVCDQTTAIRLFPEEDGNSGKNVIRVHRGEISSSEDGNARRVMTIRGKCFNATITVQKHAERCAWCPDPREVTIIGQELNSDPSVSASILSQLRGEDGLMHLGIVVLALVAIVTSAAFGCLLVVYLRQKKLHKQISVKPRFHPYTPATLVPKSDDENRYDMPWEQSRPLTYWLSSSHKCTSDGGTTTSPLDSASSLGKILRILKDE
ncbi:hypothetical protein WR25_25499 [Diploscapter pachys]|uniref:C2 domain-containing protein n=1 Tax=Diploscapter pachys TaxID=2018661 RepID=A0A2A2LD74_9BILA|nr:hypothetical protein WR25_25499 [Diploscapter pachys]